MKRNKKSFIIFLLLMGNKLSKTEPNLKTNKEMNGKTICKPSRHQPQTTAFIINVHQVS
jgi:hypothetical protein